MRPEKHRRSRAGAGQGRLPARGGQRALQVRPELRRAGHGPAPIDRHLSAADRLSEGGRGRRRIHPARAVQSRGALSARRRPRRRGRPPARTGRLRQRHRAVRLGQEGHFQPRVHAHGGGLRRAQSVLRGGGADQHVGRTRSRHPRHQPDPEDHRRLRGEGQLHLLERFQKETYPLRGQNVVTVKAEINGVRGLFILDTGATYRRDEIEFRRSRRRYRRQAPAKSRWRPPTD